jgi:hypothetical protein
MPTIFPIALDSTRNKMTKNNMLKNTKLVLDDDQRGLRLVTANGTPLATYDLGEYRICKPE